MEQEAFDEKVIAHRVSARCARIKGGNIMIWEYKLVVLRGPSQVFLKMCKNWAKEVDLAVGDVVKGNLSDQTLRRKVLDGF